MPPTATDYLQFRPSSPRTQNRENILLNSRLAVITTLVCGLPVAATTLSVKEVPDPIFEGETCFVPEIASSGTYIYNLPSKYDLVFWPDTDHNAIWHCARSGFTALMGDFDGMTDREITNIRAALPQVYNGEDDDPATLLSLLETIYKLRDTDVHFDNMLFRSLARMHQSLGAGTDATDHFAIADEYRLKALEQIRKLLQGDLPLMQRFEYLYIAANYARQLGNTEESDRYLADLRSRPQVGLDEQEQAQVSFLLNVAKTTELIRPGGALEPPREEEQPSP